MNTRPKTKKDGPSPYETDDAKWQAVVEKDPSGDGEFYYSVKTTGVFCLPSCPARPALRKNVAFHNTPEDAERAGFRACKRCWPKGPKLTDTHAAAVAKACHLIKTADEAPSLDVLAKAVGMSTLHFHRVFKALTGVTPKDYASFRRSQRVRKEKGVCAISLGDDPDALVRDLQDQFPKARLIGGDKKFERMVAQVIGFIEAPKTGLDLPLDVRGTAFQQKVWRTLREIPAGSTVSYTEIAERIGAPKAVRAVAQACASNHIAVAIPCHRVLRHDGALSGYRWGVQRKSALLAREAEAE